MTEFKPGDQVRVTPHPYDGTAVCDGTQGRLIQIRDMDGVMHAFGPNHATVELIEPAKPVDDPSKDKVGTVRRSSDSRVAHRIDNTECAWAEYISNLNDYDWLGHEDVTGWTIIGAVPGTPAYVNGTKRYFKQIHPRVYPDAVWRSNADGTVDYRERPGNTWTRSRRFSSLHAIESDSHLHEVPAP